MKKFLKVVTSAVLSVALLTACGSTTAPKSSESKASSAASKTSSAQTSSAASNATEEEGLKIAIVSSPSGVDDGSFNQDIYNGILAFIGNHANAKVTPVREESGDTAAAIQAVADIVADYDVIVCCGFQFAGIGSLAQDNANTKFILVDSYPTDAEGKEIVCDNVYAMQFKEQESGFFAGMAAALDYQYGFESGVNYANEKFNTDVKCIELPSYAGTDVTNANVGGNYVGSFSDEATGKVVGKALLDEGCDILFVAAGGSGNGVFTAVKEAKDAKIIGCDVDQYDDGANGDSNIILTSGLKVMHTNVEKQLENILAGTFKGENALLGADTDSTGYVKDEGRHQLSADTITKLDEAYTLLKDGKIVPAANFNNLTPEDFTGLK